MSLTTLILVLPIFLIVYRGVGLFLNSRKRTVSFGQKRSETVFQGMRRISGVVGGSTINQLILKKGGFRKRLDELLMRSGHPFGWNSGDLLFLKELMLVLTAVALWEIQPENPWVWGVGLLFAFVLPDVCLGARARERKGAMQRSLPGLIDLLALAIESGLDLVVSIERITDKMAPGALKEELQTLIQESRLGASRKDILQRWAFRTGLSDAQSLSSLVIQSEEMGTPLANVLRNYAEDMRSRRILRAEEIAGKIPVKILLPMIVFFFPIVFVIILGPMAVDFMKNFK